MHQISLEKPRDHAISVRYINLYYEQVIYNIRRMSRLPENIPFTIQGQRS